MWMYVNMQMDDQADENDVGDGTGGRKQMVYAVRVVEVGADKEMLMSMVVRLV